MATRLLPLAIALAAFPLPAHAAPQAVLVHCGKDTCLRLSGRRDRDTIAIHVDGRRLPVEGGRRWRITMPLSTVRHWPITHDYTLAITFADADEGRAYTEAVSLPPGSLGTRLELASLIVRAH